MLLFFLCIIVQDNYEDTVNFLLRIIWIIVSNVASFLLFSTISFLITSVSIVKSFGPSLVSGAAFYLVAALAAISTIVAIFAMVLGAGAGAVYVVTKNAAAIQGDPQRRRREYIREQRRQYQSQRPHVD